MTKMGYACRGIWDWGYCCGTVVSPTTPLVSLRISSGSRTMSCLPNAAGSPIKVGAMVTVIVRDKVPEHTIVTSGVVVVTVAVD